MAGKYNSKTGMWEPEERFEDTLSEMDRRLLKQGVGSPPINDMYEMKRWRNDIYEREQLIKREREFYERQEKERKEEEKRRKEELEREFDERLKENQFHFLKRKHYDEDY